MRIIEIAVFIFIFSSVLGAIDSLGLYGGVTADTISGVNTNDINELTPSNATVTEIQIWTLWSILVDAWNLLTKILSASFLTGYYLQSLIPLIPSSLATVITALVNVLYVLGFIQFITNRPTKTMR